MVRLAELDALDTAIDAIEQRVRLSPDDHGRGNDPE
jgi:hypothetical protein